MKTAAVLLTVLATACVAPDAEPNDTTKHVVLFAAPGDVVDGAWAIQPSDYLIDRPLHVTKLLTEEGPARDIDAAITSGQAIAIDGLDGISVIGVEGWY